MIVLKLATVGVIGYLYNLYKPKCERKFNINLLEKLYKVVPHKDFFEQIPKYSSTNYQDLTIKQLFDVPHANNAYVVLTKPQELELEFLATKYAGQI